MVKNKRDLSKTVLKGLFLAGAITIAATSPQFIPKIIPEIIRWAKYKNKNKKKEKSFYNAFFYLKKKGYIRIENKKGQIFVSLTKEGKEKAGKWQIDDLKIEKPKKWDGKWRLLIFDIQNNHKIKREALRGKIKQLGMFQLQKSVWAHPYDFQKEVDFLRSFFDLNKKEVQIIFASKIEDDGEVKSFFNL